MNLLWKVFSDVKFFDKANTVFSRFIEVISKDWLMFVSIHIIRVAMYVH